MNSGLETQLNSVVQDVELGWNSNDTRRILSHTTRDVTFQTIEARPDGARNVVFVAGQDQFCALIEKTIGAHHTFSIERIRYIGADRALVDERIVLTGVKTPQGELPPITLYATTSWVLVENRWLAQDIRVY
jgi:hypothetical protein